jgi:osmotically-inducible protein OsmY
MARDYDYRGHPDRDRGAWQKAGDEVRSWFGDEEAERRRRYDEVEEERYMDSGELYDSGGYYPRRHRSSRRGSQRDPVTGELMLDDPARGGRFVGDDYPEDRYDSGVRYYGDSSRRQGRSHYVPEYGAERYGSERYGGERYGAGRYGGERYGAPYGSPYGSQREAYHGERAGYGSSRNMPYELWREQNAPSEVGWRSGSYGGRIEPEPAGEFRTYGYRSGTYESGSYGQPSNRGLGPIGYRRSDDRIEEDAHEALTWSHDVDASHIKVRVVGGEVTLEGSVNSWTQKRAAEDALGGVRGITDIHNRLRIETGSAGETGTSSTARTETGTSGTARTESGTGTARTETGQEKRDTGTS